MNSAQGQYTESLGLCYKSNIGFLQTSYCIVLGA